MPTKRRRRAQAIRQPLMARARFVLERGRLAPTDDGDARIESFFLLRNSRQQAVLWMEHGPDLTTEWAERWPGRRPAAWWRFVAPGSRLVVEGAGRAGFAESFWQGALGVPPLAPGRHWIESQAAALRRFGLLMRGELRALDAEAFEPVELATWGCVAPGMQELEAMDGIGEEERPDET